MTFEGRENQGAMRWQAGCNTLGADVEIAAEDLALGGIAGTEIGCADGLHEQDVWLTSFFGSDPEWRLGNDGLTLTSQDTMIELESGRG